MLLKKNWNFFDFIHLEDRKYIKDRNYTYVGTSMQVMIGLIISIFYLFVHLRFLDIQCMHDLMIGSICH